MREAVFAVAKIQSHFTLPATVAPVQRTLATTVALGSFSAAFLSTSTILSSDFAAERFFARINQVRATCFQPK